MKTQTKLRVLDALIVFFALMTGFLVGVRCERERWEQIGIQQFIAESRESDRMAHQRATKGLYPFTGYKGNQR